MTVCQAFGDANQMMALLVGNSFYLVNELFTNSLECPITWQKGSKLKKKAWERMSETLFSSQAGDSSCSCMQGYLPVGMSTVFPLKNKNEQ